MKNVLLLLSLIVITATMSGKHVITNDSRLPASDNISIKEKKKEKLKLKSHYMLKKYISVYALSKENKNLNTAQRSIIEKRLDKGLYAISFDGDIKPDNQINALCISQEKKTNRFDKRVFKRIIINKKNWHSLTSDGRKELILNEVSECYL